ncbi:unnamed protein product [Lactuca saligna]|uniref:RRM domain-containing protein n=1 Tax=Lactuca saligna TaxID=75948 RepID=A0AA35ULH1_LACSI|nr:unnamed protein product [Lactuca saligna]
MGLRRCIHGLEAKDGKDIDRECDKGEVVKKAGGAAMILMNQEEEGVSLNADEHVLPAKHVSYTAGEKIKAYINSTVIPMAALLLKGTIIGDPLAPFVAALTYLLRVRVMLTQKANDPGLIFDIQPDDYIPYLCGLGYSDEQVGIIAHGPIKFSFYFTNFPEDYKEGELWEVFKHFGKVIDIFIAKKMNLANRKFGFVRFMGVDNVRIFEVKLNSIWLGSHKLRVNLAKFQRSQGTTTSKVLQEGKHYKIKSVVVKPQKLKSIVIHKEKEKGLEGKPSFAEVLKNNMASRYCDVEEESKQTHYNQSNQTHHEINVRLFPTKKRERSSHRAFLAGEVKSFDLLKNFNMFKTSEGFHDIFFSYIVGLNIIQEFENH